MRYGIKAALLGAAACSATMNAAAAQAEVIKTSDNGFITRDVAVVESNLTQTWLALISPADWWSSQHTWSADAANLTIKPQAGGCFCEKIPAVDEPDRFTLEGSVEHMRVIQAYPESALRMSGGLGPLQSEPVNGVLTIALSEIEVPSEFGPRKATRIVWEYNVGGSMRYEIPVISKAVDGVMSLQLAGLAEKLGKIETSDDDEAASKEEASQDDEAPSDAAAAKDASEGEDSPASITPQDTLDEASDTGDAPKPTGPSVDDAFFDLSDTKKGEEDPGKSKDVDEDKAVDKNKGEEPGESGPSGPPE